MTRFKGRLGAVSVETARLVSMRWKQTHESSDHTRTNVQRYSMPPPLAPQWRRACIIEAFFLLKLLFLVCSLLNSPLPYISSSLCTPCCFILSIFPHLTSAPACLFSPDLSKVIQHRLLDIFYIFIYCTFSAIAQIPKPKIYKMFVSLVSACIKIMITVMKFNVGFIFDRVLSLDGSVQDAQLLLSFIQTSEVRPQHSLKTLWSDCCVVTH